VVFQVASLRKENTVLSTELTDSAQRQETIQKNLVAGLEREKKMKKEFASVTETYENSEKSKKELQTQLAFEIQLKEAKHKQLLKSIMLTHKYVIICYTLFYTYISR
jgi:hypothetical protein